MAEKNIEEIINDKKKSLLNKIKTLFDSDTCSTLPYFTAYFAANVENLIKKTKEIPKEGYRVESQRRYPESNNLGEIIEVLKMIYKYEEANPEFYQNSNRPLPVHRYIHYTEITIKKCSDVLGYSTEKIKSITNYLFNRRLARTVYSSFGTHRPENTRVALEPLGKVIGKYF